MKKLSLALIFLFLQSGCQNQQISPSSTNPAVQIVAGNPVSVPSSENIKPEIPGEDEPYPGKTIDQMFPVIESRDFIGEDPKQNIYEIEADAFQIVFKGFTPQTINDGGGKSVFKFKTINKEDYWANLVGVSRLLGKNSRQIYVVASGTGAVCCTNYWITDISKGKPENVFRSEDFGSFRDPMEIFDGDGDGIYELVQFDSAFRYFMGDCGACAPEPRAVFKYDKKSGTYLPAKNLQQDFVKKSFLETEKWIVESFAKLEKEDLPELKTEYNRRFLDYVVDLFYLGDEKKAWQTFDQYYIGYSQKEEVRAEIKNRLKQAKFFQALKKSA